MSPLGWLNPGRWLLLAALFGALVLGYFTWRGHQREVGREEVRAEYRTQAENVDEKREAVAAPIEAKQAAAQVRIRTVTETIIKEVPVYVKADDCPMPGGFRVLHDAAANGEVPDPAGLTDAASVPAQAVASTVAGNYGTCHEIAARLTGLQEWVRAQHEMGTQRLLDRNLPCNPAKVLGIRADKGPPAC